MRPVKLKLSHADLVWLHEVMQHCTVEVEELKHPHLRLMLSDTMLKLRHRMERLAYVRFRSRRTFSFNVSEAACLSFLFTHYVNTTHLLDVNQQLGI